MPSGPQAHRSHGDSRRARTKKIKSPCFLSENKGFGKKKLLLALLNRLLGLLLAALDHCRARDIALLVDEIKETSFLLNADLDYLLRLAALLGAACHHRAGNIPLLVDKIKVPLFFLHSDLCHFLSHIVTPFQLVFMIDPIS